MSRAQDFLRPIVTPFELEVALGERRWEARTVSMGNPHAVAFLGPGESLDDLSPEGLPLSPPAYDESVYPEGVNVELVVDRGEGHVALRVHERGAGETLACGTGACAAVVAGIRLGLLDSRVDVETRGGTLTVEWAGGDRHVFMTGPAQTVFEGEIEL